MCTNIMLFPKHTCNQGFYYRHYTSLCCEHLYMFYHHSLLWLMAQQSKEHNYKEQQPSLQKHQAASNQPPANQHFGDTWARPLAQRKNKELICCSVGFSWGGNLLGIPYAGPFRVHAYMRACAPARMRGSVLWVRVCVHTCERACECMRSCVHACMHACVRTYVHACMCASVCACIRARVHAHAYMRASMLA